MGKDAFDKISAGLEDAIAHARGDGKRAKARQIDLENIDVAAIRKGLGLSQDKFANAFGVSVATLRGWEQGHRHPTGPSRAFLRVIEKEPEAVLRALTA